MEVKILEEIDIGLRLDRPPLVNDSKLDPVKGTSLDASAIPDVRGKSLSRNRHSSDDCGSGKARSRINLISMASRRNW